MTNLTKKRTATLRKLAKEQDIVGADEMERKELIDALGNLPKADPEPEATPEPEKEEVEPKEEVEEKKEEEEVEEKDPEEVEGSPVNAGISEKRVPAGSKAEIMKAMLAKQPKVRILIPTEPKEKLGATESVILNGYRLNIMKGVYVEVPQQIAEVIMESQKQTLAAADELKRMESGAPMRIDGQAPSALDR